MRWTLESRGSWALACTLATTACTDRLVGASSGDTGEDGGDDGSASEPESGDDGDDRNGEADSPDDDDDDDDDTLATVTDPTDADATTFDGESTGEPATPCDSVLAESRRCAFLDEAGDIQLAGLDSGTVCPYVDVAWEDAPPIESGAPGGLVWHDDALYLCFGVLMRVELDGSLVVSGLPCTWVTAHDDAFIVHDQVGGSDFVREYATWDDAVALGPATVHELDGMLASRFATADNVIYGAWHSTDRVERRTLDTGDPQEDVALAGFDDWVNGIDVDAGEILISNEGDLLRFDAESGAPIGEIAIGDPSVSAIDCR